MALLNLALSQRIYLLGPRLLKPKALELIINSLCISKACSKWLACAIQREPYGWIDIAICFWASALSLNQGEKRNLQQMVRLNIFS